MSQRVTLSTGQIVTVHPVSPFIISEIQHRHPLPPDAAPEVVQDVMYVRERLAREVAWLLALDGIDVPEGWTFPRGLRHAGINPREGDDGLLLDYIEYGLLVTPEDIQTVQRVMYGVALTEDEIGTAEAAFPADGGSDSAAPYPQQSE